MEYLITNSHAHPEYIEALKEMDKAYRAFYDARQKALASASGTDHFTSGTDERLFNRFLEKKALHDKLVEEIKSGK